MHLISPGRKYKKYYYKGWQTIALTTLGFFGLAAVRADVGVAKRHEQTLDFFATRYAHLLKIGGFAVRGEEEARVSRTYVLIIDSFMFAIGRADGAEKVIEGVINDYHEVIVSYLEPKMQASEK